MKFDGITIVTDMDGTLLTNDKRVSEKNKAAIDYFKKNGGTFVVASGRTYPKILLFAEELNLNAPIICNNGGVIYDYQKDEVVYKCVLDKRVIPILDKMMDEFPDYGFEIAGLDDVYFIRDNDGIQKHIRDEKFTDLKWITTSDIDFEMSKILIAHSPEKIDELIKKIPPEYHGFSTYRSDLYYYEILPLGVTKGSALFELRKMLQDKAKKVYAIGDNINDLAMIKVADFGIAVKNALPGLKEYADFILPYTNEENAIMRVIELIEKGTI